VLPHFSPRLAYNLLSRFSVLTAILFCSDLHHFDLVDVQFWRSRRSLEGLSARSVLFGVFQSVIVFLYILDNDTNMVVIVSVFISLLIDCWKITKVVVFTVGYNKIYSDITVILTAG